MAATRTWVCFELVRSLSRAWSETGSHHVGSLSRAWSETESHHVGSLSMAWSETGSHPVGNRNVPCRVRLAPWQCRGLDGARRQIPGTRPTWRFTGRLGKGENTVHFLKARLCPRVPSDYGLAFISMTFTSTPGASQKPENYQVVLCCWCGHNSQKSSYWVIDIIKLNTSIRPLWL